VTGVCLGYRPDSLEEFLPAPIHSPLSSRHLILHPDVFDDMLKKPCPYHKTLVNHTLE
jgi:hypothetical protein